MSQAPESEKDKAKPFFKRINWKTILAILFIIVAVYFFWSQRHELRSLGYSLLTTHPVWLTIGIVFTLVYISLQAALYIYSFYAVKGRVSWMTAHVLFLKRNVIAVFLPGGGLTALAYMPSNIANTPGDKQKVHHASVIYGFIGIFSVFIVAIPVLLYLSIIGARIPGTTAAFITIVVMLTAIGLFIRSVQTKGPFYRLAIKGRPKLETFLTEIFSFDLVMKQFWNATIVSILIEIVGVVHIYISMLAAGVAPSLEGSIVAYIIATIFLIISPFLRGMGAIEVSLTLILKNYGYTTVQSLQIALLFRLFEFWLPLFAGLVTYATKARTLFVRRA
jgi:phosphatidylglycerol lysyltransferase